MLASVRPRMDCHPSFCTDDDFILDSEDEESGRRRRGRRGGGGGGGTRRGGTAANRLRSAALLRARGSTITAFNPTTGVSTCTCEGYFSQVIA